LKRPVSIALALLCTGALVGIFVATGLERSVQYLLYDVAARWEAPIVAKDQSSVELVFVDQYSLEWVESNLGYSWPWPRELYGYMAQFFSKARSQTYDIVFSGTSPYGAEDDEHFAALLTKAGNVVVASAVQAGQKESQKTGPGALSDVAQRPITNVLYGNATGTIAVDGVLRQYPLTLGTNDYGRGNGNRGDNDGDNDADVGTLPSLGVAALLKAGVSTSVLRATTLGSAPKAQGSGGQCLPYIKFRGKSPSFKAYNAAEILASAIKLSAGGQPRLCPEDFADKLVFIGYSAPGLLDRQAVPVDGAMPGTEIHASFADASLNGHLAWPLSFWANLVIALCLGLLAASYAEAVHKPFALALGAVGALILPFLLGFAFYHVGYVSSMGSHTIVSAFSYVFGIMFAYIDERQHKAYLKKAFAQYLAPSVVDEIAKRPQVLHLGGEERTVTVFFSDIEGFTSLSESMSPENLAHFMNTYLSAMTSIILEEQGTIDKYVGDAIVAFWNAPLDEPDHAVKAVRTALRCQDMLEKGQFPKTRFGIHTGKAVVGNMGSEFRFNYTALGDAVNTASRLEAANKELGTRILVSADTVQAIRVRANGESTLSGHEPGLIEFRRLGLIAVPGKSLPVEVWEPYWARSGPTDVPCWNGVRVIEGK